MPSLNDQLELILKEIRELKHLISKPIANYKVKSQGWLAQIDPIKLDEWNKEFGVERVNEQVLLAAEWAAQNKRTIKSPIRFLTNWFKNVDTFDPKSVMASLKELEKEL